MAIASLSNCCAAVSYVRPGVDAVSYLEFFLEDDQEVERLRSEYAEGKLLSGEMKARAISCIQVRLCTGAGPS